MIFKIIVGVLLALITFNTFVTMLLFFAQYELQKKNGEK